MWHCNFRSYDDKSGRALGLRTIIANFGSVISPPGPKIVKFSVAVISCAHRRRVIKFGRMIDLGVVGHPPIMVNFWPSFPLPGQKSENNW